MGHMGLETNKNEQEIPIVIIQIPSIRDIQPSEQLHSGQDIQSSTGNDITHDGNSLWQHRHNIGFHSQERTTTVGVRLLSLFLTLYL